MVYKIVARVRIQVYAHGYGSRRGVPAPNREQLDRPREQPAPEGTARDRVNSIS